MLLGNQHFCLFPQCFQSNYEPGLCDKELNEVEVVQLVTESLENILENDNLVNSLSNDKLLALQMTILMLLK